MQSTYFLRIGTLKGFRKLQAASLHNRREIEKEAPNIDRSRSSLNYTLCGAPGARSIVEGAKTKMQLAGQKKLRKNGVAGLEALFSLAVSSAIDHRAYFSQCLEWCKNQFGESNILSADVHLDEAAPHCHILILPLIDGRMKGSEMIGKRSDLQALQKSFQEQVAIKFGVGGSKLALRNHKDSTIQAVISNLKHRNDPSLDSIAWTLIRGSISKDPKSWAECLGIEMQASAPKRNKLSFTQIMTKKVANDEN